MVEIAISNETSVLQDSDFAPVVAAYQRQISEDFAPVWGSDAHLTFIPKDQTPAIIPVGTRLISFMDDSDQADALGYHDTTDAGEPFGKVFVKSDLDAGASWTVTGSHELIETMGDPWVTQTFFDQDGTGGKVYAWELCDAPEADQFGYQIDGVLVSDFVYPSYFEPEHGKAPFDKTGILDGPLTIAPGGYMSVFTFGKGWSEIHGSVPARQKTRLRQQKRQSR